MCSNVQPESVQYGLPSSQICTVETQGEVPSLLEPPLSPVDMIKQICVHPESFSWSFSFSWRYFINVDVSRKDIYHINWKFAERWMWLTGNEAQQGELKDKNRSSLQGGQCSTHTCLLWIRNVGKRTIYFGFRLFIITKNNKEAWKWDKLRQSVIAQWKHQPTQRQLSLALHTGGELTHLIYAEGVIQDVLNAQKCVCVPLS